jgi:hypothetical protein
MATGCHVMLLHACTSACLHVCMPARLHACTSACLHVCGNGAERPRLVQRPVYCWFLYRRRSPGGVLRWEGGCIVLRFCSVSFGGDVRTPGRRQTNSKHKQAADGSVPGVEPRKRSQFHSRCTTTNHLTTRLLIGLARDNTSNCKFGQIRPPPLFFSRTRAHACKLGTSVELCTGTNDADSTAKAVYWD